MNLNYFSTSVTFEWGTTTSYGNSITPSQSPATGSSSVNVNTDLSGLTQGTTYHFRINAINDLGTINSEDMTFTTLAPITDVDGNSYNIRTIGTQIWMTENLKTARYNNGDPIPNVADSLTWNHLATGAYCVYDNNSENSVVYGKLYNWYAVNEDRKLCPTGWHPATPSEWGTLLTFAGWDNQTGGKLKETGVAHWDYPNTGATNETGFTAIPGGYRFPQGFRDLHIAGVWWVAKNPLFVENSVTQLFLWNNRSDFTFLGTNISDKVNGHAVRCIKD